MEAGQLRHRIVIERKTENQSEYGGPVTSWSPLASRWAGVEYLTGRELLLAQQVNAEATIRVTLRWDSTVDTVTPTDRITYGSRALEIVAIGDPTGKKQELIAMCKEAVI